MHVLICVDHSNSSTKAVQFAAGILGKSAIPNLDVTLLHVAELLPEFVLSEEPAPGMTQRSLADSWAERSRSQGQKLLDEQQAALQAAGVPAQALHTKLSTASCLPESKKIAAALSLITEIKSGPYDVICIGRRGASQIASSIVGGVAEKVIRECHGKTVWLVD